MLLPASAGVNDLAKRAKEMCSVSCASVWRAVEFVEWDGARFVFELASSGQASSFMVSNLKKLVNLSPEASEWLRQKGHSGLLHQSPRR